MLWDAEGSQRHVYELGGFDADSAVGPHDLAEGLMGRGCIEYLRHITGGVDGFYSPHGKRERIYLWDGLTDHREAWTIFHEIAERYYYAEKGCEWHDVACDQLAARLRAPRGAFRKLVRGLGREDIAQLALESGQSQTSSILRVGEVFSDPVLVVTPTTIHVRGDEYGWPDEAEIRRLAAARKLPPQLRRIRLDDAKRRYAFVAV